MISIIIPYKNSEQWIGRCAKSLEIQKGDFEFIFVDDGSEDNGPSIAADYSMRDSRFRSICNTYSAGVSGARDTGLERATGDWISFLDADDELMPRAWEKFNKMLKVDAAIYQSNHLRYYVSKHVGVRKWDNPEGMYDLKGLPQIWYGVWNKLYKRDLVKGIRFIEGMQYGEDEIFNLECLKTAKGIYNISDVIVKHNIDNMKSLSHIRKDKDLVRELAELANFITSTDDPDLREVAYDTLMQHVTTAWYKKAICLRK